jgi:hypothetical protein
MPTICRDNIGENLMKSELEQQSTQTFENYLNRSLAPVRPDEEFVNRVKYRLVNPAEVVVEHPRDDRATLVILFGSLLSGALAVLIYRWLKSTKG